MNTTVTTDTTTTAAELRIYLDKTLRKAPYGSARQIWAKAQLAALNTKPVPAARQPDTK